MPFSVGFTLAARRQLSKLPASVQAEIKPHIDALAQDPKPPSAVRLSGTKRGYRLRVGAYRVLYELFEDRLLILVVRVGHRREVYKRLSRLS